MSLKLNGVSKRFGNKLLFQNFNYEFEPKGVYALIGPSGIGKTTLMRIICGLDADYTGRVVGGGIGNCSVMFQESRLLPALNAYENIRLANQNASKEDIYALMERLNFSEKDLTLYPRELSGGMKQRISFARAVNKNAPILLLDEPTKELDEKTRYALLDIIKQEAERRLVVVITHNTDDIIRLGATPINL